MQWKNKEKLDNGDFIKKKAKFLRTKQGQVVLWTDVESKDCL